MSRIVNILFALLLLAALVIVLDPNARRKAIEAARGLEPAISQIDDRVVLDTPEIDGDVSETPDPTPTPFATAVADNAQIPVTGDEDSSDEPIIQVNWDALGDSLRKFWERLQEVKIEFNPNNSQ